MNRKRIEQELSLHLDGRLPSGRREQLLAHLAENEDTERLWDEMQRAQELALQLPGHEVSREFHDTLLGNGHLPFSLHRRQMLV